MSTLVVQWNEAGLEAIKQTHPGPPMVARQLAILHTCIYDAWAAYDPVAVGTRLGGFLRRPEAERNMENKTEAISYAAYRALADLFPANQFPPGVTPRYETLMTELGFDPAVTATDLVTPSGIGNLTAQAVLAFRRGDGSNQLGDLDPQPAHEPYADYTGYVPANTPNTINDPNRWQPLHVPTAGATAVQVIGPDMDPCHITAPVPVLPTVGPGTTVQTYIAPHWGLVTPFALTSGGQFRPTASPPASTDAAYRVQAEQVLAYSANLTDEQKVIAEYWADGPSSELPPGHWCLFAQCVSQRDNHDLDADAKMFFAMTNAIFDASIACWDAKRAFDYVRPITAIHFLFADADQEVRAWRGPYQGSGLINGAAWQPYQAAVVVTPPFPEYVSGHSTFSTAGAEILKRFTGSDNFGGMHTQPAGTSRVEPRPQPGDPPQLYFVPATDVTLYWATFSDAADQAGISRRFGGIHFIEADLVGRAMGRAVAAQAWEKAQDYITGQADRLHRADPIPGQTYFTETGHNLGERFLAYWQANGGLAQFGFPLSEEFEQWLEDGKVHRVQYFERARFEHHPDNQPPFDVLLGQLGRQSLAGLDAWH